MFDCFNGDCFNGSCGGGGSKIKVFFILKFYTIKFVCCFFFQNSDEPYERVKEQKEQLQQQLMGAAAKQAEMQPEIFQLKLQLNGNGGNKPVCAQFFCPLKKLLT